MKTTIELPDAAFRQAKVVASARGMTLKQLFTEALDEKLQRYAGSANDLAQDPPWMAGFGGLSDLAAKNRCIEAIIEAEFETMSPDDLA